MKTVVTTLDQRKGWSTQRGEGKGLISSSRLELGGNLEESKMPSGQISMQISHSTIGLNPNADTRSHQRNSKLEKSVLTTKNSSNRNNVQFHDSHIKMAKLIAAKNKLRDTDMTGSPPPATEFQTSKMSGSSNYESRVDD